MGRSKVLIEMQIGNGNDRYDNEELNPKLSGEVRNGLFIEPKNGIKVPILVNQLDYI